MKKTKLWNNIKEELKDNFFNKDILSKFINKFYENKVKTLNEDQHILFLFRIELINSDIKTVTRLLKINNEQSGKTTIAFLLDAINATSNNYNNTPLNHLS